MKKIVFSIITLIILILPLLVFPQRVQAADCSNARIAGDYVEEIYINDIPAYEESVEIEYGQSLNVFMVIGEGYNDSIEGQWDTFGPYPPFTLVFDSTLDGELWTVTRTITYDDIVWNEEWQAYTIDISISSQELIESLEGAYVPAEGNDTVSFSLEMYDVENPSIIGLDACITPAEFDVIEIPYEPPVDEPDPVITMIPQVNGNNVDGPTVTMNAGSTFSFTWEATNTRDASADESACVGLGDSAWNGPKASTGSYSAGALTPPPSTRTYILECYNSLGEEKRYTLTVNINDADDTVETPTVDLYVTVNGGEPQRGNVTVNLGDSVVLGWTLDNATDCDTNTDITDDPPEAFDWELYAFDMDASSFNLGSVGAGANGTYTLSCINDPGGESETRSANDQISLTVVDPEPPPNEDCPPAGRDCKCPGDPCMWEDCRLPPDQIPDGEELCFPDRHYCNAEQPSGGMSGTVRRGNPPPTWQCYEPDPPDDPVVIHTPGDPKCTIDGDTGIYTAIGCIPVIDQTLFTGFLITWSIGIVGGLAFLLIVYAGFIYITSTGDPKKIQKAVEIATAAITGVVLVVLSIYLLRWIGVDILDLPGL